MAAGEKVKSFALDWRTSDAEISRQEGVINTFLTRKTVVDVSAVNEDVIFIYDDVVPPSANEVKVYKFSDRKAEIGRTAADAEIEALIQTRNVAEIINLDSGTILLIY